MGFFEGMGRPAPLAREPHERKPWMGPPHGVIPGAVAAALLLGVSDQVAVQLGPLLAWPDGVALTLWAVARDRSLMLDPYPSALRKGPHSGEDLWPPEEALRVGVRFSDGRRATNFDGPRMRSGEPSAREVRLVQQSGGGSNGFWRHEQWLWPLPPEGALAFAVEWPAWGLHETVTGIDAAPLREAAARARPIWPE